jgi:hypothetical protein
VNNQPPDLSPEARRLINAARGSDDPTAEDEARVKARWLASVAAVAGVSSLTEAARAAGGIGWGLKAAGAALVIAAGALSLNFALESDSATPDSATPDSATPDSATPDSVTADSAIKKQTATLPGLDGNPHERFQKTPSARSESNARPLAASQPSLAVAPVPVIAPSPALTPEPAGRVELAEPIVAEAERPATEAAPAAIAVAPAAPRSAAASPRDTVRARPVARAVAARPSVLKADGKALAVAAAAAEAEEAPAASAASSGQLGEELALLSEVRSSIQGGAGERALELLSRYEARFGQPILGMEADALRVDALCKSGQRDAARESARAFQNEWPGSPLERRVSTACP